MNEAEATVALDGDTMREISGPRLERCAAAVEWVEKHKPIFLNMPDGAVRLLWGAKKKGHWTVPRSRVEGPTWLAAVEAAMSKQITWGDVEVKELAPRKFRMEDSNGAFLDFEFIAPVIPDEDCLRLAEELAYRVRNGG